MSSSAAGVTRGFLAKLLLVAALLLGAVALWRGEGERIREWQRRCRREEAFETRAQSFIEDPNPDRWVTISDPGAYFSGYTLVLVMRRIPALIDMNGELVHLWPEVRCKSRARLLPNGDLMALSVDGAVRRYDWEGRLLWSYAPPEAGVRNYIHHDLQLTDNGDCLLLSRDADRGLDSILRVDSAGQVVWRWSIADHFDDDFYARAEVVGDWSHLNSLREIPPNRHFDRGDPRFTPGNLLVSARNLNTIFVIARESGEVVWRYSRGLDRQHEALMVPPGLPGAGNILVFNNGRENRYCERESAVLEIDPVEKAVLCRHRVPYFFTVEGGVQQPLPNGNLLITSSHSGRVFEIDRCAEIVWQWTPPFCPMRPVRYAPGDCARFSELPPSAPPFVKRESRPFVDRDLYLFAPWAEALARRWIGGRNRVILRPGLECEPLRLPPEASVEFGCGVDPAVVAALDLDSLEVRFVAQLEGAGGATERLFEFQLSLPTAGPTWQEQRVRLGGHAYERVVLCLRAECDPPLAEERLEELVWWEQPRIHGPGASRAVAEEVPGRALTRRERVEWGAFGYAD